MKFAAVFAASIVAAASFVSASPLEGQAAPHAPRAHERKARYLESRNQDLNKRKGGGKLTWYSGGMLSAPACGGGAPGDDDMVVAVAQNAGYGSCNQKVTLYYNGNKVDATIRDYCEGCRWGHFDATKGVFKNFASLEEGVLNDVQFDLH